MKPVFFCLCLIGLLITGTVSASTDSYDDWVNWQPDPNPYAGCPTCIFAYDDDGLLDPNPYAACPTCSFIFDTGIESDLTSLADCPTCGNTVSSTTTGYSTYGIAWKDSPGSTIYTFANGTPLPEDYLCPIHGIYCPDDPRPPEDRPGFADAISEEKPDRLSRTLPETTTEFLNLFKSSASIRKSGRLEGILYRR